ncbi:Putative uncharacterized protein [Taphrina deformans PYCC 5710]|uniref:DEUBAD domain-containing protein n=1 Tax=Taphrina deformans (strain PYCC 5710 / ATCC 11124 / CBS 356.35 / IMI 108563 / JCM 9778 / NBRC 8474) TaxID=1097556 RepID=R4XD46_TAPDE|nr:Putative uncharacterized protein [Taphrina deformans PYCC 5710]|eukprot:CCG83523.1 Putative uncharacterized protein [Taphrina deformans PYCC 5710]
MAMKYLSLQSSLSQYLFTNPGSCLVSANLSSLLNAHTWQLLTTEEQNSCLELLPTVDKVRLEDGTHRIIEKFFDHNVFLQDSLRDFQDDLAAGHLLPQQAAKAEQASIDRAAGRADDFKDAQFERYWGEKQKLDSGVVAGETTNLKLTTMIAASLFEVGDVFKYLRTLRDQHGQKVTVEKDCEVVSIHYKASDPKGSSMSFRIAPGRSRYLRAGQDGIVVDKVLSLGALETTCLDIDETIPRQLRTNGNSWKVFRLQRKTTDVGSLFEIRQQNFSA